MATEKEIEAWFAGGYATRKSYEIAFDLMNPGKEKNPERPENPAAK